MPIANPNPYDSGQLTESHVTSDSRRPLGTLILAAILLVSGLGVGVQRVYELTSAFSSIDNVVIHSSFCAALTRDAVTSTTAIIGAIGLLCGRAFGWWLSILHAFWRLAIQGVLPLLGAIVAQVRPDAPSQSHDVRAALTAGCVFLGIVLYLQKDNVLSYFGVNVRRAIVNVVLMVLCVGVGFGLDVWSTLTQRQF